MRLERCHWGVACGGGDAEGAGCLARDAGDATHGGGGVCVEFGNRGCRTADRSSSDDASTTFDETSSGGMDKAVEEFGLRRRTLM